MNHNPYSSTYAKNLFKTALCAVACVLFVCCTQNSTDEIPSRQMSDRQLLEFLGYDTCSMVEREEYYLIVPDVVISKDDLAKWRNNSQTRMQRGYGLLSEEYQTIYIDADGIPEYADLLEQAVGEWNKIPNSNIEFVFDKTPALVVRFIGDAGGNQFDPVSIQNPSRTGQYGKTVIFNYAKALPLLSEPTRGKYFMMHILGHIVGFGHAVTDPFAMPDGKFINGTTVSDTESIMRSEMDILNGRNGEKWTGFSKWDINAIQFVYPPKEKPQFILDCEPAPTGTDALTLAMGTTYIFTARYIYSSCPNPKYQITVKKTSGLGASEYQLHETANGTYTIRFTKPGDYMISVKVTNASRSNIIERTYIVPAVSPKYDLICDPAGAGPDKNNLLIGTKYYLTAEYNHPLSPAPKFDFEIFSAAIDDYQMEIINDSKISIVFYREGEYRVKTKITNILDPVEFERIYRVSKEFTLECNPSGIGADGRTLLLERKYTFTPKCYIPGNHPGFQLIDIEKDNEGLGTGEGTDFEFFFDLPIQELAAGKFQAIFHTPGQYRIIMSTVKPPLEFEQIYYIP